MFGKLDDNYVNQKSRVTKKKYIKLIKIKLYNGKINF